jgi:hypothetical protein
MDIAVERSCGLVPGGHMDTNTIFTSLFDGWLRAADKAAAATINYAKSTVIPGVCDLTQKATLATGKTLVELGYRLTDCCTNK